MTTSNSDSSSMDFSSLLKMVYPKGSKVKKCNCSEKNNCKCKKD